MEIKYKKLVPEAQAPIKMIDVDAGFDFFAISKEETEDYIEYLTGIALEIPNGYVGLVFPRSSVTKYDLMLKNCVGVIDASYRGEIRCRFYDTNKHNDYIELSQHNGMIDRVHPSYLKKNIYEIGDRIAQIVFLELPKITLKEVLELSETDRGPQGFGHTGK